jgi:DNA gyrase/topoisomerase IV subunit B
MFIGDTSTPDHLAEEVVDNMLDEISNGFATIGSIFFDKENSAVWVTDNGRGIKVEQMKVPSGEMKDSVEVLCTKLFSGSKFDLKDYDTLIGMHGVGLVAVNALSDWMVVKTRDRIEKNKMYVYTFIDSKLTNKEIVEDNDYTKSTIIGFKPSNKFFDSVEFNTRHFVSRLLMTQSKFENCTFIVNNKEIPKITFVEYVKTVLGMSEKDNLYDLNYDKQKNMSIRALLTYVDSVETVIQSDVNLRSCEGTFLTSFQTVLKNKLKEKIDKKFKNINTNDLLSGLRLYISLKVPEPKFDSQTKVRMVLDVKKPLIKPLEQQLDWFCSQKDIIDTLNGILERKFNKKIEKKNNKYERYVDAENKLRDCEIIPGDVLYICEGDSADGTLKQIRNTRNEAAYPLKGKILNIETATFEKIEENKEISDLKQALGPKGNRRYRKVKILADADEDGKHIVVLVLLVLQKIANDMIEDGKVSVILPPLYGATKSKKFYPIYDVKDVEDFKNKGFNISRFKGLGEMDPHELEATIRSGVEYNVKPPKSDKAKDNLIKMIIDTNIKRAIMNDDRCSVETFLAEVLSKTELTKLTHVKEN